MILNTSYLHTTFTVLLTYSKIIIIIFSKKKVTLKKLFFSLKKLGYIKKLIEMFSTCPIGLKRYICYQIFINEKFVRVKGRKYQCDLDVFFVKWTTIN